MTTKNQTQTALTSLPSPDLADLVFVCMAETWFNGQIPGGAMPLGPKCVIAIERTHAPMWLSKSFDQGEIHAESGDDPNVQELLKLTKEGRAVIIPSGQTLFMHVNSMVTHAFVKDDESDVDSDTSQDEGPLPKQARRVDAASSP